MENKEYLVWVDFYRFANKLRAYQNKSCVNYQNQAYYSLLVLNLLWKEIIILLIFVLLLYLVCLTRVSLTPTE